jgi:methyltransferase FkbM-like protein
MSLSSAPTWAEKDHASALSSRSRTWRRCCDADGEIELFCSTDPNWGALATVLPSHYSVATDAVAVPLVKLDTHCSRFGLVPDFIKVDVEGIEADVIAGALETLDRSSASVLCEVSFGLAGTGRGFDLFDSLGYRAELPDGSRPFSVPDDQLEGRSTADILFRRPRMARAGESSAW